jgi:hypothetical protein
MVYELHPPARAPHARAGYFFIHAPEDHGFTRG